MDCVIGDVNDSFAPHHISQGAAGERGFEGVAGYQGVKVCFLFLSSLFLSLKHLLLCLVGNPTIPIRSWNRETKAYPEPKDLEDHGVVRYESRPSALCCVTFKSHGPTLNLKFDTSRDYLCMCSSP